MADPSQPLDELDYAIIAQLQEDARRSYTQIARELNVSVGTIRNRIKHMEEEGILRFSLRMDADRLGFFTPTNLKVSIQPSELIEDAIAQIVKFPEVYYLALVAGEYDLDIDVMCRDQEHLTNLITQRLHKVRGVNSVVTSVTLRVYKLSTPDFKLFNPSNTES
jgi:Lrp/AsnC family transcriptional regulator for asnA, asnC and gidA